MRIDLYTRCWNDALMLGFFFRHYDRFVQRYIVFDDGSTDASLDILRAHPRVDLRPTPPYSDPLSRVASGLSLIESSWTESRGVADWVIVTDIDEHIHHPDMGSYLSACMERGITIVPALGFQMLTEAFPEDGLLLCETPIRGAPWSRANKLNLFAPDAVEATNYDVGRHMAAPTGRIVAPPRDELMLLHYRYLGFERTLARHAEYLTRQRERDLAMRWGHQYSWSREELRQVWNDFAARLVDISDPALDLGQTHPGGRWWDVHRLPAAGR